MGIDYFHIFEQLGIDAHGACPFEPFADRLPDCEAKKRLPDNPQIIIVALFPYRFPEGGWPRDLARYACVPDYHIAAYNVLNKACVWYKGFFPEYRFVPFIDNSPVPEVAAAAMAGLGIVGDHGLLINPKYGSYVFIGCIVTDMKMAAPVRKITYCGHCGRCKSACPAGCIGGDKKKLCLSAVTQRKGDLTPREEELIRENGLAWGCDRCQEVCPHNETSAIQPHPCFTDYAPQLHLEKGNVPHAYDWRGETVLRRNLELLK